MLKRIAKAFVALAFGQVINAVTSILLVPLYLHVWSTVAYGEWLAMSAAVSYLSNLDMGVQTYVVNRLTQAYAVGNIEGYQTYQHTALAFYVALASVGSALVIALAWLAPINRWLNITQTDNTTVSLVVSLLGCQLLWSLPTSIGFAVYRTTGDFAKSQWIGNFQRIFTLCLTLGVLALYPKMAVIALAQLGPFVLVCLFVLRDIRRRFPSLTPGLHKRRRSLLREIIKPSLFFGLIILAMAIGLQGSTLLVASLLGATAVAIFVTTRTLTNMVKQAVTLLNSAMWPDLTRLEALADQGRLRLAFHLMVVLNTAGCVAVSACLWFEGTDLINLWTHGALSPNPTLLRLMLVYVVLQSPWLSASVFFLATNRHRNLSFSYLIANAGGLILAALLIPRFGILGAPIGLILAELVACYHFVVRDVCRFINESYPRYAMRLWSGMFVVIAAAGLAAWTVHQATNLPMGMRWVLSGTCSTIVVGLASWFLWLRRGERIALRSKIGLGFQRLERAIS
jgi:O-antigen/teichoic acid export membrane protein